jgi:hypothetical protein
MRIRLLVAVSFVTAACGSTVVTGHTGSGAGGSATTTTASSSSSGATGTGAWPGTGGGSTSGDCATNADCKGGTCAPITPGGYKVCLNVPPESTGCHPPPQMPADQCCTSADCTGGKKCFDSSLISQQCGGPFMPPYNECASDQCTSDAMCGAGGSGPQICVPAGAYGVPIRVCLVAYCHADSDCKAKPGGVCVPVSQPCCQTPAGLGCVYPGGCRNDMDCGGSVGSTTQCQLDPKTGLGSCVQGQGCPL